MAQPPDTHESLIRRLPNAADVEAWERFMEIYEPLLFRLATAKGVAFSFDDPVRYVTDFAATIPDASPSMRLDHLARRRSEIDVINGQVVELSRQQGWAAPYNETLCAVVRERESRFPESVVGATDPA